MIVRSSICRYPETMDKLQDKRSATTRLDLPMSAMADRNGKRSGPMHRRTHSDCGSPESGSRQDNPGAYERSISHQPNPSKDIRSSKRQDSRGDASGPPRILVVSSKVKNNALIQTAVLSNVIFVHFKYESANLESIAGSISQHLGKGKAVQSIAFILHGSAHGIHICAKDERIINSDTMQGKSAEAKFLQGIVHEHLDTRTSEARIDFLGCSGTFDAQSLASNIETNLPVKVGVSKDISGSDLLVNQTEETTSKPCTVGDMYFRLDKLKWNGSNQQTLAGFEKIRTVGKGAYGTAVLYRKKDDDSLVILKEINLHDLNASERQMALNEVRVLAMLDHPNIISYFDSFEEDGIIMIEMEYADGGTLAQYLSAQDKPLEENEILTMFSQIVSAICYIHKHNILHRDLKTANIFLTKEGHVKVGDFGISKLMSTANQRANTVLGTPYYISPEMCEGKAYNDRSDIWALGCILYEMACLQKTFEGSNLPALVNKIMKGQFAPVRGNYSQEFKKLVMEMLQREPQYRPSALEIWNTRLPTLIVKQEDQQGSDYEEDTNISSENVMASKKTRSVLYYFEMDSMQLTAIPLPSRIKIRDVSVGEDHVIVTSMERMVYTWGDGHKGQLGHGDLDSRSEPTLVESLKGKSIIQACCGDGFSIFGSDNGIIMTCGDGVQGCLGHGDWCSTSQPRLIEALLSIDVVSFDCGPNHVAAVSSDGVVHTWGNGCDGKLGLGSEESYCQPMEVSFDEPVIVKKCYCGQDGTMLLTDVGSVLACGNNEFNKLGLNQRAGFLMAMKNMFNKIEVPAVRVFMVVKALARHRVTGVAMGPNHSAVTVESGHVFTFGKNVEGQLGNGNLKPQYAPIQVKSLDVQSTFNVQCGAYCTIAGNANNELLMWGSRMKKASPTGDPGQGGFNEAPVRASSAPSGSHSRQQSTASVASLSSTLEPEPENPAAAVNPETGEGSVTAAAAEPERQTSIDSVFSSNSDLKAAVQPTSSSGFRPLSSMPNRTSSASIRDKDVSKCSVDLLLQPTPLIRMDSSGSHSSAGDTVMLSQFFIHGENMFIQVETTAPPPRRRSRKKKSFFRKRFSSQVLDVQDSRNNRSASSRDGGDEYSSETSEMDTKCSIPDWLKHELADSAIPTNDGNEPDDNSEHSDSVASPLKDNSMASIQINSNLRPHTSSESGNMKGRTFSRGKPGHADAALHPICTPKVGKENTQDSRTNDPLSSSSSSENLPPGFRLPDIDGAVAAHVAKPSTAGGAVPKKSSSSANVAAVYRAKPSAPPSQKPPARTRNQPKPKYPDAKDSGVNPRQSASVERRQGDIVNLQTEMERLRLEKLETEKRLKQIEAQHKAQQDRIIKTAEAKASAREQQLKGEIEQLRQDLEQQNNQFQDNRRVVEDLQQQLMLIQTEQAKLRPSSRQSIRESKICSVQ